MDIENRNEWLEQLTVGEEVGIREVIEGITATVNYTKATIIDITVEKILVEKNLNFNREGELQQENNLGTRFTFELIPLTPEIQRKAKFYRLNQFLGLLSTGVL
ncbi:hypothetical protein [Desemzia sp. FAM 23991]|uniref:hypothetical protein n=1 Tax=unclassified Desemzia TaxID=2685243 RepID=UPI003888CFE9